MKKSYSVLLFAALVGLLANASSAAPVHKEEGRNDLVRRGNPNDVSKSSGSGGSGSSNSVGGKKAVEPAKMHLILVDSAETALEQINMLPKRDTASVVFSGPMEEAREVYNQVNASLDAQGGAPNHDAGRRFTRDTTSTSENDYMAIYYLTTKMEVRYKGPRLPSHGPASGGSGASSATSVN